MTRVPPVAGAIHSWNILGFKQESDLDPGVFHASSYSKWSEAFSCQVDGAEESQLLRILTAKPSALSYHGPDAGKFIGQKLGTGLRSLLGRELGACCPEVG
jgi:hypothetical protein